MFEFFLQPFSEYDFMQRALFATLMIGLSGAPVGVFMNFRRLSLMGDALGHAILPGVAIAYLLAGFSTLALFVGGVLAGLTVAALSALVSQFSSQREENALAVFYLISLSLGVVLVSSAPSAANSSVDLMHILFGSVLNMNDDTLKSVSLTSLGVVGCFLAFGRLLLFEAVDPAFGRVQGFPVRRLHFLFLFLLVVSLVSAFQALGTLMALGLMLIPAASARFFARGILPQTLLAFALAAVSSYAGLLASYHWGWPSGPAIVMAAGSVYLLSLLFGAHEGLIARRWRRGHRKLHAAKVAATTLLFAMAVGFSPRSEAAPLKVVASFSILAEMTKSLGGDVVEVRSLIPPGAEVHAFQPKPKDLVYLKGAELFVANGLGLEPWAGKLLKSAGFKGRILFLGDALPEGKKLTLEVPHHHHGHAVDAAHEEHDHGTHPMVDPHAWQDPQLGLAYLTSLRLVLTDLRPAQGPLFEQKFSAVKNQIERIDRRSREQLEKIPAIRKQAVSSHDSFGYLKRAYGLSFLSPKGGSTESEVSAKRLASLEKRLKSGEIKVAFVEDESAPTEISGLIEKYGLKRLVLYSDSLTHSEGGASTYVSFLESNSERLIEAFANDK